MCFPAASSAKKKTFEKPKMECIHSGMFVVFNKNEDH